MKDEKDIAKASRVEKGKEKVAEWVEDVDEESENKDAVSELPKKAEVSITEKGKEKAIEWVEDVDEEGENKDAVSALPKHTKVCVTLHVWRPPRMTFRVLAWMPHHKSDWRHFQC